MDMFRAGRWVIRHLGQLAGSVGQRLVDMGSGPPARDGLPDGAALRFERVQHPRDTVSPGDTGWRFAVACAAAVVVMVIGLGYLALLLGLAGIWNTTT